MKNAINEKKAASKAQQKFMGMVHAVQKGELDPKEVGPSVRKAAKSMPKKAAKEMASTKHKKLPNHVDENMKITKRDINYVINEAINILNERHGYGGGRYYEMNLEPYELLEDCEYDKTEEIYQAVMEENIPLKKVDASEDNHEDIAYDFVWETFLPEWEETTKWGRRVKNKYRPGETDVVFDITLHGYENYDPGDYWTPPYSDFDYDSKEEEEYIKDMTEELAPLKAKGKAYAIVADYAIHKFEEMLDNCYNGDGADWREEEPDYPEWDD